MTELEKLGQVYQEYAIIGHEAAVNSNTCKLVTL